LGFAALTANLRSRGGKMPNRTFAEQMDRRGQVALAVCNSDAAFPMG